MKEFLLSIIFLVLVGIAHASDSVVIPRDTDSFTVKQTDTIRFTARGAAPSKFEIKIDGPAKVDTRRTVSERRKGKHLIGADIEEFEIKATNKGKVKVKITIIRPDRD